MKQVPICEYCNRPCALEVVYWQERHGFTYGPYEQMSEEVSGCCGMSYYMVDKVEADKLQQAYETKLRNVVDRIRQS
ncbi:MAG: hypothetical protein KGJ90_03880 [Patescibacteria group bacterium]|nr:hypothetical protein [Patescibacteria group bacterium]